MRTETLTGAIPLPTHGDALFSFTDRRGRPRLPPFGMRSRPSALQPSPVAASEGPIRTAPAAYREIRLSEGRDLTPKEKGDE